MNSKNILLAALCSMAVTACCNCGPTPFPEVSEPIAITSGPHDHFFASYFGINSWSPDNRYVTVLETDANERLVEEGEYATIALVDLEDNNKLIPVARTCCWNFQEAAMCHWLPWAEDTFLYNDLRDGKFVSVILNWKTTSFTCNIDGTNVRRCFPDGWGGSHFNWKDDKTLAVTAKWDDKVYGHTIFTVGEEDKVKHLGPGILDFDGHCIFSPNGKFISTDGYWNEYFYRSWALVRLEDEAVMPLGSFFVPENYRNTYSRCDLHPRFRPDGRQIGFNSVHEGSRQVYIRNIDWK